MIARIRLRLPPLLIGTLTGILLWVVVQQLVSALHATLPGPVFFLLMYLCVLLGGATAAFFSGESEDGYGSYAGVLQVLLSVPLNALLGASWPSPRTFLLWTLYGALLGSLGGLAVRGLKTLARRARPERSPKSFSLTPVLGGGLAGLFMAYLVAWGSTLRALPSPDLELTGNLASLFLCGLAAGLLAKRREAAYGCSAAVASVLIGHLLNILVVEFYVFPYEVLLSLLMALLLGTAGGGAVRVLRRIFGESG